MIFNSLKRIQTQTTKCSWSIETIAGTFNFHNFNSCLGVALILNYNYEDAENDQPFLVHSHPVELFMQ